MLATINKKPEYKLVQESVTDGLSEEDIHNTSPQTLACAHPVQALNHIKDVYQRHTATILSHNPSLLDHSVILRYTNDNNPNPIESFDLLSQQQIFDVLHTRLAVCDFTRPRPTADGNFNQVNIRLDIDKTFITDGAIKRQTDWLTHTFLGVIAQDIKHVFGENAVVAMDNRITFAHSANRRYAACKGTIQMPIITEHMLMSTSTFTRHLKSAIDGAALRHGVSPKTLIEILKHNYNITESVLINTTNQPSLYERINDVKGESIKYVVYGTITEHSNRWAFVARDGTLTNKFNEAYIVSKKQIAEVMDSVSDKLESVFVYPLPKPNPSSSKR